ncbi:Holliday junction DNA helicase RuvA [Gammaproteobacteria bacterium 45_16_T64]|nr:Holliday junction DNA helicase RuvA [Gammaproteobacteria bacterium 45_16_T64]
MTLMGFDFGTQKIGIAIGQQLTQTASALPELPAKEGQPQWQTVAALIDEWQPDAFVVGIPLNEDGTENALSARARKFGNRLHGRFGLPLFTINEHLSSYDARDQIQQYSGRAAKSNRYIDSVAAVLILESWFSESKP